MCDVPFPQCGQWSLHCNASRKGALGNYWTLLRVAANKNTPIDTSANVFALTSYSDQADLARLCLELGSDKCTITLPLITIYPASCDVAMSGVDIALEAVTARPDDELCMTTLHTWRRMLNLNVVLPDSLQSDAFRALMKCDPSSINAAAFFLEQLFDPCAEVPCHSARDLLLHFSVDPILVNLLINRWNQYAESSVDIDNDKFETMRRCLDYAQDTPFPAADHASYPSHQAAASRFYDEMMSYLTANPDLVCRTLKKRLLKVVWHYELDPSCIKLVILLKHANFVPAKLIPIVRLINSVYELHLPPGQAPTSSAETGSALASLISLLPGLNRWEPALMGIDKSLAAAPASSSTGEVMSLLCTWKQLLDLSVPTASSVALIQTTVDLLVTKYDSTTCVEPVLFFIEQLYKPTMSRDGQNVASFFLHKLLFQCNMDSTLVDAYLSKWRSYQDVTMVDIKCACLYQCLFEVKKVASGVSTATYVSEADSIRYSNQVNAYIRIVEEMLVCFRLKPALFPKHIDKLVLQGISHYSLEAICLPGLTDVIKAAKLHRQVLDKLLICVPVQYVVSTKKVPTEATNFLGTSVLAIERQLWLRPQKVLSPKLCTNLSAHRKLLLGKVSCGITAEAVLDAFIPKDKVDVYLKNLYGCIDDDDADLPLLLEFTAQCEQLPMPKLTALVPLLPWCRALHPS